MCDCSSAGCSNGSTWIRRCKCIAGLLRVASAEPWGVSISVAAAGLDRRKPSPVIPNAVPRAALIDYGRVLTHEIAREFAAQLEPRDDAPSHRGVCVRTTSRCWSASRPTSPSRSPAKRQIPLCTPNLGASLKRSVGRRLHRHARGADPDARAAGPHLRKLRDKIPLVAWSGALFRPLWHVRSAAQGRGASRERDSSPHNHNAEIPGNGRLPPHDRDTHRAQHRG